jgi:chorismate lyase / 3-hydroxybenzoate synthase
MHRPLRASYETGTAADWLHHADDILAVFEFGRSPLEACDPRHVPVALRPLDASPQLEVWRTAGPVRTGAWDGLQFAQGEYLTMGHIAVELVEDLTIRESSRLAYERLQSYLEQSPHPWALKIWNYIPGINDGEGDAERYRQFCLGRAEAVSIDPAISPALPAATGIGTPLEERALQVYFLAGALPGLDVENPRQVSAWRYPRRYGPKSPLFSRATILRMNGSSQFLLSGTASIVGHQTHHENQAADQLSESLRNVRSLLDEGHRLMGDARAQLDADGILKVYVRRAGDLDAVRRTLETEVPAVVPRLYLQGDICRASLLTEIDGIVNCRPTRP